MIRPKIGVLVFSESLVREDVYKKRKPISDREVKRFVTSLETDVDIVWPEAREIRSKKQAVQSAREIGAAQVDAVVLYVPIFVAPALVAHTANLLHVPIALACNEAEDSLSQLVFLAAAGALDQIGLRYLRVPGDAVEKTNRDILVSFLRAAAAKQRLRGQTYGCIGGRSLGISTGTADVALWESIFAVDIEHVDQFEIAYRAERLDEETVKKHVDWLMERTGTVDFNESNFTPPHLEKQVRSYIATRDICEHYELDFAGVKCQPEMSNGYCLQCINVAISNDPFDADGDKEPVPTSCEADADGALTMQILKLLSGGRPTSLNDIAWMTAREMTLANCGSMAFYFAGLSPDLKKNLKEVSLVPHSFGEAGGASTQFTVPAGNKMTFARLFRTKSQYTLGVLTGNTVEKDRAKQSPTIQVRPLIFVDMNIDKEQFLSSFGSNHIHAVEGDLKSELKAFAELLEIEFIDYDLPTG
ncbi:MAG: hypothetical protein DRP71_00630 [Verrucomicrobia bacterium]|nr:MAG: hypothetical protein DRP71_00630 [Verrucomicrobiota bacterium]